MNSPHYHLVLPKYNYLAISYMSWYFSLSAYKCASAKTKVFYEVSVFVLIISQIKMLLCKLVFLCTYDIIHYFSVHFLGRAKVSVVVVGVLSERDYQAKCVYLYYIFLTKSIPINQFNLQKRRTINQLLLLLLLMLLNFILFVLLFILLLKH